MSDCCDATFAEGRLFPVLKSIKNELLSPLRSEFTFSFEDQRR